MAALLGLRSNAVDSLVLSLLVLSCLGFTIGLTYAPCYSSMCVEDYFPLQARGHIGLFYGLLVGVGLALWARVRFHSVRAFSEWHPKALGRVMLVTGKRVSMGAVLLLIWIIGLSFGSIGYWYPAENAYWMGRGEQADWTPYIFRVVWTGVTGHWIDIWIGLTVIPVGRNSILGRAFQLHASTLLYAHKLFAYALFVGGLIHGLIYYSFLAAWVDKSSVKRIFLEFTPDNPALTWDQSIARGVYYYLVLPTGAISGILLIPIIVITSLPVLRRLNYNTFYFIHVIFAFIIMVLICIHASTNFYCLLPGLLLWVADWVWRARHALGKITDIHVEDASNGWYRVQLPPQTYSHFGDDEKGNSPAVPDHPLISYYLNVPEVSKLQSHPFTVAAHLANGPSILLQRGPERKKAKQTDKEWTWKLAALVKQSGVEKGATFRARIEGPYVEYVPRFHTADHVLAIAGGTGITGALALANSWLASPRASDPAHTFRLVWTIREPAVAQLQEIVQLRMAMAALPNADLVVHVSRDAGRIDPDAVLREFLSSTTQEPRQQQQQQERGRSGHVWVYASGPRGLLASTEAACTKRQREARVSGSEHGFDSLDWHIASFEL